MDITTDSNPMMYAIVNILGNNILISGITVPVATEEPPLPGAFSINLVERGANPADNTMVFNVMEPLPPTHPYYDPKNPNDLYNTKVQRRTDQKGVMDIHIWAESSSDRDSIVRQIITILNESLMFNYKYCVNLSPLNICSTTNETCDAIGNTGRFGIQGKCPYCDIQDPTDSNYRNPSTYYDLGSISPFLVAVRGEQNVDDLSTIRETYHSVLQVDYTAIIVNEVNVNPLCEVDTTTPVEILPPRKN